MELTTSYQLISSFNITYGAIRTYAKYSSQSATDNTTTYQIKQVYYCNQSGGYIGFDSATGVLDGTEKSYNSYTRMYYGETTIQELNRVIEHNVDGSSPTKNITTSWTASFGGSGSTSVDITFPSIARYPIVTGGTDFYDTQNPSITFTTSLMPYGRVHAFIQSNDGMIVYVARYDINILSGTYTYELTEAERTILRNATPNSNTLSVRLTLQTIAPGGTEFFSYVDKSMVIHNANPTFNVAYQDTNATTIAITGDNQKIIQNNSTLQINITNATALKGASLSTAKVTINGVDTTQSISTSTLNIDIGTVNLSYDTTIPVVITDTRGNTTQIDLPISILSYSKPTAIIDLKRKQNYYTETDITPDATFSSLDGNNTLTIEYKIKKTSEGSYGSYAPLTNNTTTTFNADNLYAWDVKVHLQDLLDENTYDLTLNVGIPILFIDRQKYSVGINCLPTGTNTLEVNGNDISNTYSTTETPIGTWTDGKTIYRQIITIPSISTYSTSYDITSIGIENLVNMRFIAKHATNYEYYNFYSASNDNLRVFYRVNNAVQTIEIRLNSADTFDFTVILEYTKV